MAAARLLDRGLEPLIVEAGAQVGASIAQWKHVRLFSPWCLALDPVSVRLLTAAGWVAPDPDTLPTGAELLDRYLGPLAALPVVAGRIRLGTRVIAVARRGLDRVRTPAEQLPILVRVRGSLDEGEGPGGKGGDRRVRNLDPAQPAGRIGPPGPRGADAAACISYGSPDILGRYRPYG